MSIKLLIWERGFMPLLFMVLIGLIGNQPYLVESFNDTLIGGVVVPHSTFPELIYLRNSDGARCSGAIVGPSVILTAAHCVSADGLAHNAFTGDGFIEFNVKCEQTPQYYSATEDLDFALCKSTNGKIVGAVPATLGRKPIRNGDEVILTGYGCTSPRGGGGNDGPLKWGKAKVFSLPRGANDWFYAQADDAALCYGDSGGPSFRMMDPLKSRHIIVGVNSRGNILDLSLLTAMYMPKSRAFLKSWAKENHVGICGVNIKCKIGKYTSSADDDEDVLDADDGD